MADHKKRSYKIVDPCRGRCCDRLCGHHHGSLWQPSMTIPVLHGKTGQIQCQCGKLKADGDVAAIPEQISEVKVKASYIPDGMAWIDGGSSAK